MMDGHTKRTAGRVYGTFVFALGLVLFLMVNFDFYYDLNDDTMIKDILSGAYTGTPSGYCIQMLYPLSWSIALCYRAVPEVPWYGLFLCLCQFWVLIAIAWRLTGIVKGFKAGICALVLEFTLVVGLFLRQLVIIQYSVTAGMCMIGAVFLFMTAPHVQKASSFIKKNLLPLVFVILALMIRTEVCIMLLPFLLLAGLSKWGSEEKIFTSSNFRKYLMLIGIAFLGMLTVYSIDLFAYRESDWSSFRSFFDARTKLYDFYGLPDYDENIEFYTSIGLSRESFALLENYNFALDDSIDTWSLDAIVDYQEQRLHNTLGFISKNTVKEALWLYKENMFQTCRNLKNMVLHRSVWSMSAVIGFAVFAAYLLYIVWSILCAKGMKKVAFLWKVLPLLVIRAILWLYLYMVDRVLDRVTVPLFAAELIMVVCFFINDVQSEQERNDTQAHNSLIACATTVVFLLAGIACLGSMVNVRAEYTQRAEADLRWNALMDYCRENSNNYYVIDVYSSTSYQNTPYSEKIFINVDNSYKNFDICGGWAVKSPLTKEKLAKMGRKDVQNALCSRKKTAGTKTCFVAVHGKKLDWLVAYYKKRGLEIRTVCTDKILAGDAEAAFAVYELKVVSSEENG